MADQLPDFEGGAGRRLESMPVKDFSMCPATSWYAVTPSTDDLDPPVKAILLSEDATVTMTGADGVSVAMPLSAGPQPFAPTKITAVSAGTVYGLHDATS